MADLEGLEEGEIEQGGVVNADAGGGLDEAEAVQRAPDGEGSEGRFGEKEEGPGEADAVEAHGGDATGDGVQRLLAQPLRHHGLQMGRPVSARQLHPPPRAVDDPSGAGGEREDDVGTRGSWRAR